MPYVIDDVMKIQTGDRMTSRRSVPCPCSDLSTNKSLSFTIGYNRRGVLELDISSNGRHSGIAGARVAPITTDISTGEYQSN